MVGVWLFLSGCVVVRQCPIETLQPAKLVLPEPKQRVAIYASAALLSSAIRSNEIRSAVYADSLTLNVLYSLQRFWQKSPGFENTDFHVAMAADVLANSSEFDLIVRLDRMQAKNTYYGEQITYLDWETYLHVNYVAEWLIYDRQGQLVDTYVERDLIVWESGIRQGQSEALAALPNVNDAWWDMGIEIAKNYAARVSPYWAMGMRSVYMINKFPELSRRAYLSMQKQGYHRAFNIWDEMLLLCRKRGHRKTKSRIAYNMAVACEFENEIDRALYWAQRSTGFSQHSANTEYLNSLLERQAQRLQLDQQINQ